MSKVMDQSESIKALLEKKNMACKVQLCLENCENEAHRKILVDGLKTLRTEIDALERQMGDIKEQSESDTIKEKLLNSLEYSILQIDTGLFSKKSQEAKERIIRRESAANPSQDSGPEERFDKSKIIEFFLNEMRIVQNMESTAPLSLIRYGQESRKRLEAFLSKAKK